MSILGKAVARASALDGMKDIELNKTFARVAADLGYVPGGHYSLAECQPYASPRPRNSKGQFTKKGQTS